MADNPYKSPDFINPVRKRFANRNVFALTGFSISLLGWGGILALVVFYPINPGFCFSPSVLFPLGLLFSFLALFRPPRRLAIAGCVTNAYGCLSSTLYFLKEVMAGQLS